MSQSSSMSHVSSATGSRAGSAPLKPAGAALAVGALPSEQARHAMKPSRWVLFLRTCFVYQLYRFFWINLRMIRMIWLSHRRTH